MLEIWKHEVFSFHLKSGAVIGVPLGPLALALAAVAALFAVSWLIGKRRSAHLHDLSRQLGLSFREEDPSILSAQFSGLFLFELGHLGRFQNVLRGRIDGVDVLVFDFIHIIGNLLTAFTHKSLLANAVLGYRKNSRPSAHRTTVAAFRLEGKGLPRFELRRRNVLDNIGEAVGLAESLDFPERPEFVRRFLLRGDDPGALRRLFGAEILEYLEKAEGLLYADGGAEWLVVYLWGDRIPVDKLRPFLGTAGRLYRLLTGNPAPFSAFIPK